MLGIGKLVSLGFLLERLCHVDDLAASLNGLDHFFSILLVELLNRVVAGNYKVSVHKRDGSSFGFSCANVMVHPDLEQMPQARTVVIV